MLTDFLGVDLESTPQRLERGMEKGMRVVVVSALQFSCSDDISTNVDKAERYILLLYHDDISSCFV